MLIKKPNLGSLTFCFRCTFCSKIEVNVIPKRERMMEKVLVGAFKVTHTQQCPTL